MWRSIFWFCASNWPRSHNECPPLPVWWVSPRVEVCLAGWEKRHGWPVSPLRERSPNWPGSKGQPLWATTFPWRAAVHRERNICPFWPSCEQYRPPHTPSAVIHWWCVTLGSQKHLWPTLSMTYLNYKNRNINHCIYFIFFWWCLLIV